MGTRGRDGRIHHFDHHPAVDIYTRSPKSLADREGGS
nr:MAG TPA: hypothetical protein [Caudoviricetes sp.]